jgi:mRNA interferase RelE/StbE
VKIEFKTSFLKDISKIKNRTALKQIKDAIEDVEGTEDPKNIAGLKKLKGEDHYYRIRVGEYRLGLSIGGDTWVFVRCLHRKDIYRYFP